MNNEACVRDIEAFFARLDAGGHAAGVDRRRPLDHRADPQGDRRARPQAHRAAGPCALIHFDAHTDSYDNMPHWLGAKRSAAHWAAYTASEGSVDPPRSMQIGMRGHPSRRCIQGGVGGSSRELGYQVVTMARVRGARHRRDGAS